ncbi:hypothetical protein PRZ48_010109 [Zasmidium cellare]|uniref:Uncharacterized protein n=1 Tax=Zasmidium cellare TaxID=395010 RepID=A0ABR0EDL4_ZASCE|nr:hypothetical protein PRZ48_010109 [Zasmidium cellare]
MASSSADPVVMLGWAGTRAAGSGIWVIERPTQAQLQIFRDADFPYREQASFADPVLMQRAGARFYNRITECPPAQAFVRSTIDPNNIPPLMFGFDRSNLPGGYILRNPAQSQIQVFRDAQYDFRGKALCADARLMEEAGAEQCADMNNVAEFVAIILRGSVGTSPARNVLPDLIHLGGMSFHINHDVPQDVSNEFYRLAEERGHNIPVEDIPEHLMRYRAE